MRRTVLCALVGLVACGGESEADVQGGWCGKPANTLEDCRGDELGFMNIEQAADGSLSGEFCEAYQHECYALSGKVNGNKLRFKYTFSEYDVTGELTVEGSVMIGTAHSEKCMCSGPARFYRIGSGQ